MPERIDTTHVLMDRKLVLYQRERSDVWQCRYKVDGQWHRATTKEYEFDKAKARAERLMIEAEIRKAAQLPVVTRKFRDIAKHAIKRMEDELDAGGGKVVCNAHSYWFALQVVDRHRSPSARRVDMQRLPRPNQRKHTTALLSFDLGDSSMAQAKTLTPQELRRVLDHIATRPHAARNRAMLLMTHWSGSAGSSQATRQILMARTRRRYCA